MNVKLSPKMEETLIRVSETLSKGWRAGYEDKNRTVAALISRGVVKVFTHPTARALSLDITPAGWEHLATLGVKRPADEGRLSMDEALAEAQWADDFMGFLTEVKSRAAVANSQGDMIDEEAVRVTASVDTIVDEATTNRSVDAFLTREFPALFPANEVSDVDTDTITSSSAYHSPTGRPWETPPTDGLATVKAWSRRVQAGVWIVDGTTVAVRTDDRGHIRGAVIVLETAGSKFPEPADTVCASCGHRQPLADTIANLTTRWEPIGDTRVCADAHACYIRKHH